MTDEIVLYRGKPLTDYTKEELIEIVKELGRTWLRDQAQHKKDLDMLVPTRRKP